MTVIPREYFKRDFKTRIQCKVLGYSHQMTAHVYYVFQKRDVPKRVEMKRLQESVLGNHVAILSELQRLMVYRCRDTFAKSFWRSLNA